ncbi:MAG: DUF1049 domain-containing protein [Ruminococcus sp.]|nr:DUF1049 domain-containing protein [Ruminococcus sp.]
MFCRKCGKEILSDSEFCNYCGEAVRMVANNEEPQKTSPVQTHKPSGAVRRLTEQEFIYRSEEFKKEKQKLEEAYKKDNRWNKLFFIFAAIMYGPFLLIGVPCMALDDVIEYEVGLVIMIFCMICLVVGGVVSTIALIKSKKAVKEKAQKIKDLEKSHYERYLAEFNKQSQV